MDNNIILTGVTLLFGFSGWFAAALIRNYTIKNMENEFNKFLAAKGKEIDVQIERLEKAIEQKIVENESLYQQARAEILKAYEEIEVIKKQYAQVYRFGVSDGYGIAIRGYEIRDNNFIYHPTGGCVGHIADGHIEIFPHGELVS